MQGKELALSPGVALKIHASADGLSPIPDLWLDTRKGRKTTGTRGLPERHAFFFKPFFKRPHTQNFTDLPVSPGMPV